MSERPTRERPTRERPEVTLVVATSIDGKISTRDGKGPAFMSPNDMAHLRRLRSLTDAVVVGAGTIANDDPTYRLPDAMRRERSERGQSETPIRAVISGRGTISPEARLFQNHASPSLVFVSSLASERSLEKLRVVADVRNVGETSVSVAEVVRILGEEFGVRSILLEGGSQVNAAFLEAGLIDEVHLTVAPCLIGGETVPTPISGEGLPLASILRMKLVNVRELEGEVFLHYKRANSG